MTFKPSSKRPSSTPASSKKKSITEKKLIEERIHRAIDKASKNYVTKICEENECVASSCRNNTMPCLLIGEEHIKVDHLQLAAWSKAINQGNATIKQAPRKLQIWAKDEA